MKRFAISISGLFAVLYLSAMPAAAQRTPAPGRWATAHGSGHEQASGSKGEATNAGPKTPGALLTQNKKLSDRLTMILKQQNPPVTDLQAASQGFGNLSAFVATVHVSQNLGIPFDQLKTQKQTSGTLPKAIHVLEPDADAYVEIWRAAEQAVDDIRKSSLESVGMAGSGGLDL